MTSTELDLKGASKNARDIIAVAVQMGWRITRGKHGNFIFETPGSSEERVSFSMPQTAGNAGVNQQWMNKLVRYGPDRDAAARLGLGASKVIPVGSILRSDAERATLLAVVEQDSVTIPTGGEYLIEKAPAMPRTITSAKPFQAKNGLAGDKGKYYDSPAITERKWSDGTTDYACTRCDYVNATPQQVGGHQRKHLRGKDYERPETYVGPAYQPDVSGSVTRLANQIAAAKDMLGADASPLDLATFIVNSRKQGEDDVEHRGPLTDEQVIERIRSLVDRGAYMEARERSEKLEATVAELGERLSIEASARQAAESKWAALKELMNES